MSKIYDTYKNLKLKEVSKDTLYLFKAGIFFIFVDEDARIASNLLGLKIGKLNESIVKCGFPTSSLEKYSQLLKYTKYSLKIVDTESNIPCVYTDYINNIEIRKVIDKVISIDIDNLSISGAFDFLYMIQKDFATILDVKLKSKGEFFNE